MPRPGAHNAPIYAMLSTLGTWAMPSPVRGFLSQKTTLQCWCYLGQQRRPGSAVTQQAQGQSLWKALDWMAFSSSEGLQTQPVSCFTWISILSDGASISTLLPVAFNLCPQGELLLTQFRVLSGTGTADSDTGAEPAATETRAELPTPHSSSQHSLHKDDCPQHSGALRTPGAGGSPSTFCVARERSISASGIRDWFIHNGVPHLHPTQTSN